MSDFFDNNLHFEPFNNVFVGNTKLQDTTKHDLDLFGHLSFSNIEANDITMSGSIKGHDMQCHDIDQKNGSVNISNVTAHDINVQGSFKGKDIDCNRLTVKGDIKCTNLRVDDVAIFRGNVKIEEGRFNGDVFLEGNKIELNRADCYSNMYVKSNAIGAFGVNLPHVNQKIYFSGYCILPKQIYFESKGGEVYIKDADGYQPIPVVINGKIIFQ